MPFCQKSPGQLVLVAIFLAVSTMAPAAEKKIKKSDLPPAVRKAAEDQGKGATIKGYSQEVENGKTLYEVELVINGHSKDVTMDAAGKVVEVEEEVALDSLPTAVRKGLADQAHGDRIGKVESLTKNDKLVAYEAQVVKAGKRSEIQVGADGKPLAHKE